MLGRRPRGLILGSVFLYLVVVRTYAIADTFWLYGEQVRDWTLAVGPWSGLPLVGTPSTAGGHTFGPIYYWVLWLSRVLIGPMAGNLPHAGGIGISLLQSAADVWLLSAIWTRWSSLPLALGVMLLADGPFDLALSAVVWNPPVAVAFVKMTMAMVLTQPVVPSMRRVVVTTALAWFAVQAHSSALVVAAPVLGALVARPLVMRDWRGTLQTIRTVVEVIAVLQLPWLWHHLHAHDSSLGPTVLINSVAGAMAHPWTLGVRTSYAGTMRQMQANLTQPWLLPGFAAVAGLSLAVVLWRAHRHPDVLAVSAVPTLLAVAALSNWTMPFDQYWFLTIAPTLALTIGLALTGVWRPGGSPLPRMAAAVFLAAMIVWQPWRIQAAQRMMRLPEYRALVKGTQHILRRTTELRWLRVSFVLPPGTDELSLYFLLGGRGNADAEFSATIDAAGNVSFERRP